MAGTRAARLMGPNYFEHIGSRGAFDVDVKRQGDVIRVALNVNE
jgi:hypothetical protein|tara:strand:+ start:451 stop:582 length:132 start_codon:yes stop_codon:yes gene_type:complete